MMSDYMIDVCSPLVAGILLQAAKDYCKADSPGKRATIIRQLRSDYMVTLSNGSSSVVADKLIRNSDEISKRILQIRA